MGQFDAVATHRFAEAKSKFSMVRLKVDLTAKGTTHFI